MNKFTYYRHKSNHNYFARVNHTGEVQSYWNDALVKAWVHGLTTGYVAVEFEKIGIRQLPSGARNASYTTTLANPVTA
jgi:hypothetical protein